MDVLTCRRCPADILFAKSASTGKVMPVDAKPYEDGNVRIDSVRGEIVARVLTNAQREQAKRDGIPLYKNHFATCSAAASFRK